MANDRPVASADKHINLLDILVFVQEKGEVGLEVSTRKKRSHTDSIVVLTANQRVMAAARATRSGGQIIPKYQLVKQNNRRLSEVTGAHCNTLDKWVWCKLYNYLSDAMR